MPRSAAGQAVELEQRRAQGQRLQSAAPRPAGPEGAKSRAGRGECRRGLLLVLLTLCSYRVEGVVGRGDAAKVDKDRLLALRCGDEVR